MAKSSTLTSIQICAVLLITIFVCSEAGCCHPKETKMTVFLQEFTAGPNATAAAVAGIPGRPRNSFEFGTVIVADATLTQGISINSPTVGRGQGIYVTSSRDGNNTHDLFSFIFTNQRYNGSTLEFQGRSIQRAQVRELSVVSGTKMFRFARGYATFETVLQTPSINYMVVRCNITIREY